MEADTMKPLYIYGQEGTQVSLDAPALRVTVPNQADRLFPLQRISRMVVSGSVSWETPALLACADHGISVVFIDGHAEVRARWLGRCSERQAFIQRLADFMALPDAPERYQTWRQGILRMAVRSAARRMGLKNWRDVDVGELQKLTSDRLFNRLYRHMTALLLAETVQILFEQGVDANSELFQDAWLDLPGDLARVLVWDFVPALLAWVQTLRKQAKGQAVWLNDAEVVRFYDARSQRVGYLCRGLLNKMHRWLLESG
jgi:hypothetical protein